MLCCLRFAMFSGVRQLQFSVWFINVVIGSSKGKFLCSDLLYLALLNSISAGRSLQDFLYKRISIVLIVFSYTVRGGIKMYSWLGLPLSSAEITYMCERPCDAVQKVSFISTTLLYTLRITLDQQFCMQIAAFWRVVPMICRHLFWGRIVD